MRQQGPLHFGCGNGGAGHYSWTPDGRHADCRWLDYLDGLLPPEGEQVEGVARLHHFNGCTLLAFWDRSVDSRPGSNSAFLLPGKLTFEEALKCAKRVFPKVFARFKFEIRPEVTEVR